MVLLVVDTQKLITNEDLYRFDLFENNVKKLIASARANDVEVIYIRHDDGMGSELTKGTAGFEIYGGFEPKQEEVIFDKTVNSAFKGTGLLEYLRNKKEQTLIVVGLQTDYCIDATIKCGFEHGFRMIVPEYANSTFDNFFMSAKDSYKYYNEFMWKGRYAECISVDETINIMKQEKLA
ncbi:MAG: cysteine hydrolase [Lachnospiraceae bacterium]|nr:cysteine hydrolase [Lachnospiraceae bacterium]